MVINVYSQYFEAAASFSGVERRGALVLLISDSEAGTISYRAAVSFFPYRDEEDFAVSYDAYFEKVLYSAPGRRSRKREAVLLASLRDEIDALLATLPEEVDTLASAHDAKVLWSQPLSDARLG